MESPACGTPSSRNESSGDEYVVQFDLPGVNPDTVDVSVERNVLTVKAERPTVFPDGAQIIASERTAGSWSRQLFLGDNLDTDHIRAEYDAGVLTLRIPVAERAKPRRIAIAGSRADRKQINV